MSLGLECLTACCLMGFNPAIGSQEASLWVSLLKHFPAMSVEFSLSQSLEMLVALGLVHGLPSRGRVAAELEPYRRNLARLARGCQKVIQQDTHVLERGVLKNSNVNPFQLLEAYARLL